MNEGTEDLEIDGATFSANAINWLAAQAAELNTPYLLAFADNGVIWGHFDGQALETTGVQLEGQTLQAARLFGSNRELAIWREGSRFVGRLTDDETRRPAADDMIEETYWLWGTADREGERFTPMTEGQQGLRHSPPVKLATGQRAGLIVRHYVAKDAADGVVYIARSRLVGLKVV